MGVTSSLANEKCTACRRDSPRVTEGEVRELKPLIPDWALIERDGIQRLERMFRFANQLSRYNTRLKTITYRPGRELAFTYDGPSEEARDALLEILAIALSESLEPSAEPD